MNRDTTHLLPQSKRLLKVAQLFALISLGIPLAAGKWGSYIGFYNQGIFLGDFFLFSACLITLIIAPRIILDNFALLSSVWIFIIIQFMRNPNLGNAEKIRDLVPYIYLGFYQPIAYLCKSIGFKHLLKVVRIATIFHLAWTSAISLGILKPFTLPFFFGMPVFTTRWDQTGYVIAIGLVAWSGYSKYQVKGNNMVRFGFLLLTLTQGSRAGLLAFVAALLWIFLKSVIWEKTRNEGKKDTFLRFLLAFGVVALLLLPSFIRFLPENSVLGRIGVLEISESARANASGTANDRRIAQQKLLNWVKFIDKTALGVGPGVEMVYESGAFINLSGSIEVRSPHSWPVGAIARFGIFGFFFWILLIYLISRFKFSDIKYPEFSWTLSILLTSLVGVIIESPFGSLPMIFFLCSLRINQSKAHDKI